MILLERYIEAFLKEAASTAIANSASDLTGMSHHQSAASYSNDMSEIDNQETLLKVLENVGNNCFISFVDKYDEKIPRLEISPEVSYDTPHGNYAYPLNIKSLKDIIEKGRIGGADFALNRPYFHMFKKSDSLNSIEIQSDGSNNYRGNYDKDLRTIIHTAVMFSAAKNLERNPTKYAAPSDSDEEENRVINFNWTKRRIKRKIKANSTPYYVRDNIFNKTMSDLTEDLCYLVNLNNKKYPREVVELIVNFLTSVMELKINSGLNKFFMYFKGKRKLLSKFHGLFYACFTLAKAMSDDVDIFENKDENAFDVDKINNPKENRVRQGSIFTMLLNSIDIDFINDKGSSTLHSSEPVQAVYLNSSKKENVVLVGTFNNIFSTRKINSIDDLFAAYHNSSSSPNKGPTMNKVVDIIERNPQLQDLFGTALFDDVKLEHALEDLREKAYADLTKKKLVFVKFLRFHSANKVFDLNIYVGKNKLIVFDIGFKGKFLKANINQQLIMIKKSLPKIVEIENNVDYLQVFLSKYNKKNVYTIRGMSALSNMTETLDKIQDYTANFEIKNEEDQKLVTTVYMFIYFAEDIIRLANIAHSSSLHNS
tara:strand:- start:2162 stop:3949 length:1788 start_codon:yes stop_codon:yes gene_type:complete